MGASEWVAGWARIKPDEPAIVFEGTPRSWRDLDVRASWIGDAHAETAAALAAALPRTTSGRILRRARRERMARQLAGGALSLHAD